MKKRISKAEARTFKRRWEDVNAVEKKELRKKTPSRKLHELTALMAWGRYFGWSKSPPDKGKEVRERWNRLLRAHRG